MIQLHDAESGNPVGSITEAQLQFLMQEMEEESDRDRDYYVSTETIEMLEADGADPELVQVLRAALGGRPGAELRWEPQ